MAKKGGRKVGVWKGEEMSGIVLKVLRHPLRRQILRELDGSVGRSPVELSKELDADLSNLSYHVSILSAAKVIQLKRTEQVRGSVAHYYVSALPSTPQVEKILAATLRDDERRAARRKRTEN